jgi:hypothetical protein
MRIELAVLCVTLAGPGSGRRRRQVWITADGGTTWERGPNVGRTVLGIDRIGDGHR